MSIESASFDGKTCTIDFRIYYEDTDCGGVVYYGNYLRYFEWGRTEFLRLLGFPLTQYIAEGILFVVAKTTVDYKSPGRYNDLLSLTTRLTDLGRCSITFNHVVHRKNDMKKICEGFVKIVSVNQTGAPVAIPADMRQELSTL